MSKRKREANVLFWRPGMCLHINMYMYMYIKISKQAQKNWVYEAERKQK